MKTKHRILTCIAIALSCSSLLASSKTKTCSQHTVAPDWRDVNGVLYLNHPDRYINLAKGDQEGETPKYDGSLQGQLSRLSDETTNIEVKLAKELTDLKLWEDGNYSDTLKERKSQLFRIMLATTRIEKQGAAAAAALQANPKKTGEENAALTSLATHITHESKIMQTRLEENLEKIDARLVLQPQWHAIYREARELAGKAKAEELLTKELNSAPAPAPAAEAQPAATPREVRLVTSPIPSLVHC